MGEGSAMVDRRLAATLHSHPGGIPGPACLLPVPNPTLGHGEEFSLNWVFQTTYPLLLPSGPTKASEPKGQPQRWGREVTGARHFLVRDAPVGPPRSSQRCRAPPPASTPPNPAGSP